MLLERATQLLLSLSAFTGSSVKSPGPAGANVPEGKRIAVVGAGTAGLGALAGLLALPEDVRRGWRIDLFEERDDVGGVWFPDPTPPTPGGALPETPLYPRLRTNTPVPTMTYPHFPFLPGTPLYPSHSHIYEYHRRFASSLNGSSYIHTNHAVSHASYSESQWTVTVRTKDGQLPSNRTYDHLIVANGHNHYPHVPEWDGIEEWLDGGKKGERKIFHSIYYREPEAYEGQTVVVVGFSASGGDMAAQIAPWANKLYHSYTPKEASIAIPGTIPKPRITHLDSHGIVFTDGTRLSTSGPTTILLGTGYDLLVPFLHPLSPTRSFSPSPSLHLHTNSRYIRSLQHTIFAIDERFPVDALAFVGLPINIANAPSDFAQGLFVAHAIGDGKVLEGKKEALRRLEDSEDEIRERGDDPFWIGHRFNVEHSAEYYQDGLITHLHHHSSIPLPSHLSNASIPYVEPWRRRGRAEALIMRRGWIRAEGLGIAEAFTKGVETEEEWAEAMQKVYRWEAEWEERGGEVDLAVPWW